MAVNVVGSKPELQLRKRFNCCETRSLASFETVAERVRRAQAVPERVALQKTRFLSAPRIAAKRAAGRPSR
eukprot:3808708-Lingulodinium_polyedra.AAC.1